MSDSRLPDYLDHIHHLDVVWETVKVALPELLTQLPAARQGTADGQ